jgi:hypothetical protein
MGNARFTFVVAWEAMRTGRDERANTRYGESFGLHAATHGTEDAISPLSILEVAVSAAGGMTVMIDSDFRLDDIGRDALIHGGPAT